MDGQPPPKSFALARAANATTSRWSIGQILSRVRQRTWSVLIFAQIIFSPGTLPPAMNCCPRKKKTPKTKGRRTLAEPPQLAVFIASLPCHPLFYSVPYTFPILFCKRSDDPSLNFAHNHWPSLMDHHQHTKWLLSTGSRSF